MIYQNPNIEGWMRERELEWLYTTASKMHSVVEVGSWKGRSTHALLSGCKGFVFAVDHFKGNIGDATTQGEASQRDICEDFKKNVGYFPNLIVMKMDSVRASEWFRNKSVDMVFLDGAHLYEEFTTDIKVWMPICKKIICGHDLDWNSVLRAVGDMIPDFNRAAETLWWKDLTEKE